MDALPKNLSPDIFVTAPDAMAPYLTDCRGRYTGALRAVAKSRSVTDGATLMRWPSQSRVRIGPQRGNTGLSGVATPDSSGAPIVHSLTRMNAIKLLDPSGKTIVAEAGCILAELQRVAD